MTREAQISRTLRSPEEVVGVQIKANGDAERQGYKHALHCLYEPDGAVLLRQGAPVSDCLPTMHRALASARPIEASTLPATSPRLVA